MVAAGTAKYIGETNMKKSASGPEEGGFKEELPDKPPEDKIGAPPESHSATHHLIGEQAVYDDDDCGGPPTIARRS